VQPEKAPRRISPVGHPVHSALDGKANPELALVLHRNRIPILCHFFGGFY
jgi:hypothetical protein